MNHQAFQTTPEATADEALEIVEIVAYPVSVAVTNGAQLAIGRAIKRDAVIVKVVTACGIVGWGEAHHARSANVIAGIVNTTLRDVLLPATATDIVGIWSKIYHWQLRSHGLGAAAVMAMSGLDMALWDIKAKAAGLPLCELWGGSRKPVRAYAGGVALGWQDSAELIDEIQPHVEAGYSAVKLRIGDRVHRDIERMTAVRKAFGDGLTILADANTGYTLDDVRVVMPVLETLDIKWLEEPFAANDYRSYADAAAMGRVPLAAGENHYTRFEFARLVADGAVKILQPDLSKAGGPTEALRIAALGSAWRLPICPHSSVTALNMATTIHFLSAIDNAGYFEADVSKGNVFREGLGSLPYEIAPDGTVIAPSAPGNGITVDEEFVKAHPFIEGKCFV